PGPCELLQSGRGRDGPECTSGLSLARVRPMTSGRVRGGFNQYGFSVGILMLDTRFPRIPGDMGNATTFPFPVRYHRVAGSDPDRVVRQGAAGLLGAFVDAARQLESEGVGALTTNCRFLVKFQRQRAKS